MKDSFEIYRAESGDFHWRRVSPNGSVKAASDGGFDRLFDCQKAVEKLNGGENRCTVRILNSQTGAV